MFGSYPLIITFRCDLASLKSVRECAEQLSNSLEKIDILINNAGVMTCPLTRTEDGFEMQIGTNHLGHFLLTNLVMPLVKKAAPGARIVNVSSLAHESGVMQWDDLNWNTTPYSPIKVTHCNPHMWYQGKVHGIEANKGIGDAGSTADFRML